MVLADPAAVSSGSPTRCARPSSPTRECARRASCLGRTTAGVPAPAAPGSSMVGASAAPAATTAVAQALRRPYRNPPADTHITVAPSAPVAHRSIRSTAGRVLCIPVTCTRLPANRLVQPNGKAFARDADRHGAAPCARPTPQAGLERCPADGRPRPPGAGGGSAACAWTWPRRSRWRWRKVRSTLARRAIAATLTAQPFFAAAARAARTRLWRRPVPARQPSSIAWTAGTAGMYRCSAPRRVGRIRAAAAASLPRQPGS